MASENLSAKTISIIIPAYNNLAGLVRLLGTFERLTWPREQMEIIVVNDGSTDATARFLDDYDFDLPITLINQPENRGRSAARNAGLDVAKNEFILFIDSDMEAEPDLIEQHLNGYVDEQCVGVVGEFFLPPFVQKNVWFRYLDAPVRGARKWHKQTGRYCPVPFQYLLTGNLSVRRAAALKAGGFSQHLDGYGGQDSEFAYRIIQATGGYFAFNPNAIAYHQHEPLKKTAVKLHEYGRKSLPVILERHPELSEHLPARLVEPLRWSDSFSLKLQKLWAWVFLRKPFLFIARG
ncbi:MAG: glycosyltransferase, partial [Candidatus Marinimicrobia bacterium]|nr:glycosyltransferase [Candidatus Neomarinimicrobiota bacterium]